MIDKNITQRLTGLVHAWLLEHKMKATTAKSWQRREAKPPARSYYWNYFYINNKWRGFNVYDDDSVKLIL